jgi:hypothetical protein
MQGVDCQPSPARGQKARAKPLLYFFEKLLEKDRKNAEMGQTDVDLF